MSISMGFDIHIDESENITDEIEKTLEELNLEGYTLSRVVLQRLADGEILA